MQLKGTYTPMGGQIAVSVGDRVIASWPADSSGSYNSWVDIPGDLLTRFTEVTVTYNHGDVGEQCGAGVRSSLSLDSSGEVRSEVADPPTPSGFASLPQALMPRNSLAWTRGDVADVARAVALMSGLQRLSAVRLGVDVVPLDDAMSASAPAVVIAADGQGLPELSLPVTADGFPAEALGAAIPPALGQPLAVERGECPHGETPDLLSGVVLDLGGHVQFGGIDEVFGGEVVEAVLPAAHPGHPDLPHGAGFD